MPIAASFPEKMSPKNMNGAARQWVAAIQSSIYVREVNRKQRIVIANRGTE
jgi:hypothetical protein